MATGSVNVIPESYKAGGDMSSAQYQGVVVSADNTVNLPTAGGVCAGVLQNKPAAAGRGATVLHMGRTKIKAGGTLTYMQRITMAASGWFVKATSGSVQCGMVILGCASGYVGEAVIVPNFLASTTSAGATQV
jgi:hypothetical protein